ncbi:ABC-F family ATP-binding cassette domain-containing protein [Candidatus Dependentiae bacterium]
MIKLDNISLSFGERVLFDHISCNIAPHQKVGFVGRNGAGKTTLLKVIAGQQHIDEGKVHMPKSFECAFMPQDVVLTSERTIVNEALCTYTGMEKLLDELVTVEQRLKTEGETPELLARYAHLHAELNELEYEKKRVEAIKILEGLGFSQDQLNVLDGLNGPVSCVSQLSVGWKMRLVLAKLLLKKADFYLFDEPTNHLDLIAKDWFSQFLKDADFGFLLVSHDKYFLDTVCEYICDISLGNLKMYNGNYSKYIMQKEADKALLEKKYEEQQKFIKKKMATIDKFRYKASKAKMAQSMLRSLEKMDKVEIEREQGTLRFSLAPTKPTGKIVLTVNKLGFSFPGKRIFKNGTFQIGRGHKVAIVAPNGTGKSTLLGIIMGSYEPQEGRFELGHNVKPVFFQQDQNKSLNKLNTVLEEAESVCKTDAARARVRNLLGAFLFSGDDVNKKISVLSGGEKNRVAMVKVLLQGANFLILDEPTNHLDIQSKNVLLDVLSSFDGTILFVSHDRSFLNSLATDILELTENGTFSYKGNYDEYLYHKDYLQDSLGAKDVGARSKKVPQKNLDGECKGDRKNKYSQQKQLKKLESSIAKLEKEIRSLMGVFETLEYGTEKYSDATKKLAALQDKLKEKNKAWEALMLELGE